MYRFFTDPDLGYLEAAEEDLRYSVELDAIKEAIHHLKEYYDQTNFRVKSNHILVQLIKASFTDTDDDFAFNRFISDRMSATASQLGIITGDRAGQVLSDQFIGGIDNCMIYLDEVTEGDMVKCLYHPYTNIKLPLLDTKTYQMAPLESSGVSTYVINGKSLMTRYRKEYRYNRIRPREFVYRTLLPEMLTQWYNIALFNRASYPTLGFDYTINGNQHPTAAILRLPHKQLHKYNSVTELRRRNLSRYEDIFRVLPCIGNMREVFTLPNILYTRHTIPFIWHSLLPVIIGMLAIGGKRIYKKEGRLLNDLDYYLNRLDNGSYMDDYLPEQFDITRMQLASVLATF